MQMERTGIFQLAGKDATIVVNDIKVGQITPDFKVHALNGREAKL